MTQNMTKAPHINMQATPQLGVAFHFAFFKN